MYRIRYEIIRHGLNQDNYKISNHIGDGYLYGDTIDEIKKKCIDFTIENNYTEQLDTLKQFELNEWMINEYTLKSFNDAYDNLNSGFLSEEWKEICFENIEIVPKTIDFNFEKELLESDKYQSLIKNGAKFIEKTAKQKKRHELNLAKKQYERKLKELEDLK